MREKRGFPRPRSCSPRASQDEQGVARQGSGGDFHGPGPRDLLGTSWLDPGRAEGAGKIHGSGLAAEGGERGELGDSGRIRTSLIYQESDKGLINEAHRPYLASV